LRQDGLSPGHLGLFLGLRIGARLVLLLFGENKREDLNPLCLSGIYVGWGRGGAVICAPVAKKVGERLTHFKVSTSIYCNTLYRE
jgi:hypothetical protein